MPTFIASSWPLFAVAALTAFAAFPVWTRALRGERWLDLPRADRHHARAVPRTGGVAWWSGVTVAIGIGLVIGAPLGAAGPIVVVALGAAAVVGRMDDLGLVRPARKQALQVVLLMGSWLALRRVIPSEADAAAPLLGNVLVLAAALTLQLALNIFDHLDGNVATVSAIGLTSLAGSGLPPPLAAIAATGAGASLGFLGWNRPPAAGFLANLGSQAVALLCALLVGWRLELALARDEHPSIWLVALAPFAWPLIDLVFVSATRPLRGEAPWVGGRDHLTHRLARMAGSDRRAWLAVLVTTASAAALAFTLAALSPR